MNILRLALALLLLAGCGTTRPGMPAQPPDAAVISAAGDQFTEPTVWVTAGEPFTIYFRIADLTQHDLRIWSPTGNASIAATEIFGGPSARILEMPALGSGAYLLTCDIHPDMRALLEVR